MDLDAPLLFLGGLSPRVFLRDHWQKKPLLVRGGVPAARDVVSPDDLRRLATQPDATSRLILETGGAYPWELREGPFTARDLRRLGPDGWALLVQEVDRHVPAARALLDASLAFLPRWRVDDAMVSLAPAGGGVGAHVDNYDVFLIQGRGRRRWRIGTAPVEDDTLVDGLDVAVLADFQWTDEHVLDEGDLLYLPPRVAHEGVALDGECLTISLGLRAPSHRDVLGGLLEHALLETDEAAFYTDPDLEPTAHPGEIAPEALRRLHRVVLDAVADERAFALWLGRHLTEARREPAFDDHDGDYGDGPADADDDDEVDVDALDLDAMADDARIAEAVTPEAIAARIAGGDGLAHAPSVRLAYVRDASTGEATLFAGGEAYRLEAPLAYAAPLLADVSELDAARLAPHLADPDLLDLVAALVADGALVWA